MVVRAYEGCDGSGKTTLIAEIEHKKGKPMHASAISHAIQTHRLPGWIREPLIAIERIVKGWILKLKDKLTWRDQIMDRSYISGIVYSRYWGTEKWMKIFKLFELRPDEIYLLLPFKNRTRPKRDLYVDDVGWFNTEYYNVLKEEGYKRVDRFEYLFGVVTIWRKENDGGEGK